MDRTIFEYDNKGRLIIDNLVLWKDRVLYEIKGQYYYTSHKPFVLQSEGKRLGDFLVPYLGYVANDAKGFLVLPQYRYVSNNCVPRNGFTIPLGRAITKEEFDELVEHYHLTEEDITEPFEDTLGGIYGEEYMVSYKAIQIAVQGAIALTRKLRDKGIEASNGSHCRVNIRIE